MEARVLKEVNRASDVLQRDVAQVKPDGRVRSSAKVKKQAVSKTSRPKARGAENSDPPAAAQGSRDQAEGGADRAVADHSSESSQDQQQQRAEGMEAEQQQQETSTSAGELAAAGAGSGSLSPVDDAAQPGADIDVSSDDDEIEDDSDYEQGTARARAGTAAKSGRGRTKAAALPPRKTRGQQQHSSDDELYDKGSDSEADEISASDEDSQQEQPQQQRRGRPQRLQKQPQPQQPPAAGRARRAAAVAAVDRMRGAEAAVQQQEQAVRCSGRTTRAAAAASPDGSGEDVPVARPRRAAAAAAKQATADALAAEAAPGDWAGADDSSDLGTPDASDAESDEHADRDSSADEAGGSDSDGSGSEGEGLDEEGSWGTGAKKKKRREQPTRQQPKRGRGNRAVNIETSEEPDSEPEAAADEDSPHAADASEGSDDGEGDLPLDLNAFRYDGKGSTKAAAAAAGKRGQGKQRVGSGSGSREGSEEPGEALAAVLQAEEELARDVADPAEFAPAHLDKLPRGADVDKCIDVRYEDNGDAFVLVKLVGKPYRYAVWLPVAAAEAKRPQAVRNFRARHASGHADTDWTDTNNINPQWYRIDRIVSEYKHARKDPEYLVKWRGLEYAECTWESEEEICRDGQGKVALNRYRRWSKPPRSKPKDSKRPLQQLLDKKLLPDFKNGRKLRDYQEESLHWMVNNYRGQALNGRWQPRNCILGDEMGLGKTAQSIAVMSWLHQYAGAAAPCLVVAPLTTLGHWKREIETWTDLNVVLYAGSAADRQIIRDHEFYYIKHQNYGPRFNVLLASYETVLKDKTELKKLKFEALIVDEAHRLKNQKSATRLALQEMSIKWLLMLSGTPVQNNMKELQGLMSLLDEEAYGDVDEFLERFGSDTPSLEQIRDLQAALAPVLLRRMKEDVEDLPEKEEVVIWVELTAEQRRYYRALYSQQIGALLAGVSSKNLPGMRNLAMELRKLCCHPFLCNGLKDDMTLQWAAAHSAAADKTQRQREIENYTRASGKMLLLHKLLPKLRAEGRQVLIFSQFKMMLDVIEDYLTASEYPFERIDGDTKHGDRQAAIDRFMNKDRQRSKTPASRPTTPSPEDAPAGDEAGAAAAGGSEQPESGGSRGPSPPAAAAVGDTSDPEGPFVFLLSTRAGGQGITLTSADTVIIYDSDWNPQNDLQAMARCHRIGQEKEVTVYRLVSKNTYEQQLFECSSRKMGLDEAILGFAGSGDNPENDAARIEQLLRLGAHAIMQGGGEGGGSGSGGGAGEAAVEEKGFAAEDIEQILLGRSEKRQLGCRKGNTFSIAHFGDGGGELVEPEQEAEPEGPPKDAKAFWSELLPEAAAEHAARAYTRKEPEVLGPRRRKQVDYREANLGNRSASSSSYHTGTEEDVEEGDEASGAKGLKRAAEGDAQHGAKKAKKKGEEGVMDPQLGRVVQPWKATHVDIVRDAVLRYGADCMDKILAYCRVYPALSNRQPDELRQLVNAITVVLAEIVRVAPKLLQEEQAAREAQAAAAAAGDVAAAQAYARSHGNLSVFYVNGLRDAMIKAGLESTLPPACSKALLTLDVMRKMGRSPAVAQQQLADHHQVHERMVAAGLAKASSSSSKAAAAATGGSSQQQEGAASTPAKSPAAAAAGAAGDASKRVWVAPRVQLKGSKGMPMWWKREHDDLMLQGTYAYGFSAGSKLNSIVEDILADPKFGFKAKMGIDPVAVLHEEAERLAPPPTYVVRMVQQTAADGSTQMLPQQFKQQAPAPPVDPVKLAAAQREKLRLEQAHLGIELYSNAEWRKLVLSLAQRIKRVRNALLDPTYVEPETPSRQLPVIHPKPVQPEAAAAGAGTSQASVQQRLQLTPAGDGSLTYKGKKVIGGGLNAAAAAAAQAPAARPALPAAAAGAQRTPPSSGWVSRPVLSPAELSHQQRLLEQQNSALLANVRGAVAIVAAATAAQDRKRQAEQQLNSAAKRANGSTGPGSAAMQQQQQQAARAIMEQASRQVNQQTAALQQGQQQQAAMAEAARQVQMQQQRDLLQRQQQAQQRQQQQHEVVELLSDDSSDDLPAAAPPARATVPAVTPASAGAAAAAAPPSSGLMVRRVPVGADLSQEQSVDEPSAPEGAHAGDTPALGATSSDGKQHMHQLLGNGQSQPAAGTSSAADHPVYGTPAGAAAAAAAPGPSTKRKQGKEDPKQRKLTGFFAVAK